jgi:hypothetical protein
VICLYCESPLPDDRPQTCACEVQHRDRPPISGINHVSQVLCALDDLRAEEIELEEMESVVDVFLGLFERFEQKWRPGGVSLAARLTPTLQERFATTLSGIDTALEEGSRALEILQSLDDVSEQQLDEAETALIAFFQAACGHAATALDDFDGLKSQLQSSGAFFNLRSS